jgi:bacteriocin-like protein
MMLNKEKREELMGILLQARSAEEAAALLKEVGGDAPQAERIWNEISAFRDDKELSIDELEAVSGGVEQRDYWGQGCAATVEPGSDCWGTDGGCSVNNIEYQHMPNGFCPDCGRPYFVEEIYSSLIGLHRKTTCCNYCDRWSRQEWWDGGKPVN